MKKLLFAAAALAAGAAPASAQSLDSKGNPFFASAYHDFIRDPVRVAVPGRRREQADERLDRAGITNVRQHTKTNER